MRVVFVNPPFWRLLGSRFNGLCIGIHLLAELLREQYSVDALVLNADHSMVPVGDWVTVYNSYPKLVAALTNEAAPIWGELGKQLRDLQPDVVAVTSHGGSLLPAIMALKTARRWCPDARLVVGGPRVTVEPEPVKLRRHAHLVVQGEAEQVVEWIIRPDVTGVMRTPGLTPLESFPLPKLTDKPLVHLAAVDWSALETARGCEWGGLAGGCNFCSSAQLWPGPIRCRPVDDVVQEMRYRAVRFGQGVWYILDEDFLAMPDRMRLICNEMLARKFSFFCEARVTSVDEELADTLKCTGCARVKLGVEFGSDKLLSAAHKGITMSDVERACRILHAAGLLFTVYLMLGWPEATDKEFLDTLPWIRSLGAVQYTTSITVPHVGTVLWKQVKEEVNRIGDVHLMHMSDRLRGFWGLKRSTVRKFLELPGSVRFVDQEVRRGGEGWY